MLNISAERRTAALLRTRAVRLEVTSVVLELLELLATRGVRVVEYREKVQRMLPYIYQKIRDSLPCTEVHDKFVLLTIGQLANQCLMLQTSNDSFNRQLVEWRISSRRLDRDTRRRTGLLHNLVVFAVLVPHVHPSAILNTVSLATAMRRAAIMGSSEAENTAKRLVQAIVVSKALWVLQFHPNCAIQVSPPVDIPADSLSHVGVFYARFQEFYRNVPGMEAVCTVPFDKLIDWFVKSTRIVMPKVVPPVSQELRDLCRARYPDCPEP